MFTIGYVLWWCQQTESQRDFFNYVETFLLLACSARSKIELQKLGDACRTTIVSSVGFTRWVAKFQLLVQYISDSHRGGCSVEDLSITFIERLAGTFEDIPLCTRAKTMSTLSHYIIATIVDQTAPEEGRLSKWCGNDIGLMEEVRKLKFIDFDYFEQTFPEALKASLTDADPRGIIPTWPSPGSISDDAREVKELARSALLQIDIRVVVGEKLGSGTYANVFDVTWGAMRVSHIHGKADLQHARMGDMIQGKFADKGVAPQVYGTYYFRVGRFGDEYVMITLMEKCAGIAYDVFELSNSPIGLLAFFARSNQIFRTVYDILGWSADSPNVLQDRKLGNCVGGCASLLDYLPSLRF